MEKQYNYFYKIENTLNGKFYYGVHGTDNLEDSYLGSGKRIKHAIKKYGKENFKKENLLFFETFDQALDYEIEIVNEELILDPNCYNLMVGGKGGNNGKGVEWYQEQSQRRLNILWKDPEFRKNVTVCSSTTIKKTHAAGKFKYGHQFKDKHHTKETKESIGAKNKVKQLGSGNSQYGTCWITNKKENKKIRRGELIPEGWSIGRVLK